MLTKSIMQFRIALSKEKHFRQCLIRFSDAYLTHQSRTLTDSYDISRTNNFAEDLKKVGLSFLNLDQVQLKYPELTKMTKDELGLNLNALAKCQFGEGRLEELIGKHPYLLGIDPRKIEEVFIKLTPLFMKSELFKIFLNSPLVFYEPLHYVFEKVNYLEHEMGFSKGQIANNGALIHSLNYIKLRHEFLVKTGSFNKINHNLKNREKHFLNPRIELILNTSEYDFSTKIAGVTLKEFEVFKELFQAEDS